MEKEFDINEILKAVNSISNIKKNKNQAEKAKKELKLNGKKEILTLNNQVKSIKSDVLVLNQMIE